MPLRIQTKAIGGMLKGRGPKEVVQPAVGNPDEMGFSAFYAAVLSHVSFDITLQAADDLLLRPIKHLSMHASTQSPTCLFIHPFIPPFKHAHAS